MLQSIAIIFLVGLAASYIFIKFKLPGLLGMILAGMLIGPYGLNLLDSTVISISADLRKIALIIVLMRAGLSLDIRDLKAIGMPAFLMCFVPATFEIIGIVLVAPKLLGVSVVEAAIIGSVVAAVSPAVIVPRMLKMMEEGYGQKHKIPQLLLAGASVDDVFVIILFTSFTALAKGQSFSALSLLQVPISVFTGIALGVISGLIVFYIIQSTGLGNSHQVVIMLGMSFVFVTLENVLGSKLPMSGLLAVMSMGAVIMKKHSMMAEDLCRQFTGLWAGGEILLFVLVGATVDIGYIFDGGMIIAVVIIAALIFRMAGVLICLMRTKLTGKEKTFCVIAYMPKATVQAAIGGVPLAMGLSCGNIVLTAAVTSILITAPIGAIGIDLTYRKLLTKL